MQPTDLSGLAQYLGPGTGGLWMGEQQRNAMQESELSQRKTLEDILTNQQTRDISSQKLPGELEMQQQNLLFKKGEIAKQGTEAQDRVRKIKKEDFQEFTVGLGKMDPATIPPVERAAYLNELVSRTGQDPEHPLVMAALRAHAQGGEKWKLFQEGILVAPDTRFREQESTARQREQTAGQIKVAEIGKEGRVESAQLRLEAAQAKAAQVKLTTDQLIAKYTEELRTEKDPQRRAEIGSYIQYLQQGKIVIAQAVGSGRPDELERTLQMFQEGAMKAPPPRPLPQPPQAPGTQPQVQQQATEAFGAYEPDKYEYGINPATGKFARKLKGQ